MFLKEAVRVKRCGRDVDGVEMAPARQYSRHLSEDFGEMQNGSCLEPLGLVTTKSVI